MKGIKNVIIGTLCLFAAMIQITFIDSSASIWFYGLMLIGIFNIFWFDRLNRLEVESE